MLIDKFCGILEALSSEKGKECLDFVCDDTPTPLSLIPSDAPSPSPSAMPSEGPSASPSASPSGSPSALPSSSPSASPSAAPTLTELQSIVNIELVSSIILDVSITNVPSGGIARSSFEGTLEDAVADTLSLDSLDTIIDVNSIEEQPTGTRRLRRLQDDRIAVVFGVNVTLECRVTNCDALATNMIASLDSAFEKAAMDGSLTAAIRQEAATRNVAVLTSASVISGTYVTVSTNTQVTEPIVESNEETTSSSAALTSAMSIVSLICLMLPLLAF